MNKREIIELQERIEQAKQELSEKKGELKSLKSQLLKDFKCTPEEIPLLMESMEKEIETLKKKRQALVSEIEQFNL